MELLNNVAALAAAIFGAGWGAQFIYYRIERRKRLAETKAVEVDVDIKEAAFRAAQLEKAYDQIKKMQTVIDREREKWVKLAEKLSKVEGQLRREIEARESAEASECTILDCEKRKPPKFQIK